VIFTVHDCYLCPNEIFMYLFAVIFQFLLECIFFKEVLPLKWPFYVPFFLECLSGV
jgi:hypothetical protein